jgi:glucosamine--fructose-6-phosphate aminotransferase (isomerizing)
MVKFANPRTRHPFHMHDMILGQPGFVRETLDRMREVDGRDFLGRTRNVVVTGCGTSYHAAMIGARLLQEALGDDTIVHAVHAYDLMHGFVLPRDCVVLGVSHSGSTPTTNQALALARRSGVTTRGICGLASTPMTEVAEETLVIGSVHDHSWANTMSYTTQLTAFMRLAETASREPGELFSDSLAMLPRLLKKCLACEPRVRRLARRVAAHRRVTFLGSGLDEVTALEGALKIRETSSLPSSGYHVEQFLHGPFLSVDRQEVVIALRSGDDDERETDILRGIGQTGANITVVGEAGDADVRMPTTDRFMRPIVSVVPLQFVAYYVALARKADPDIMRSAIPRYRKALEPMFA